MPEPPATYPSAYILCPGIDSTRHRNTKYQLIFCCGLISLALSATSTPMHQHHFADLESSCDAEYDCESNYELENDCYIAKQSTRVPSPLSLSLLSESKLVKSEPLHSYSYTSTYSNTSSTSGSSGASTSSTGNERYGRSRGARRVRAMELYGRGFDEEDEDETELSDEGYVTYEDALPRFRTHVRPSHRSRAASPLRSPVSAHSVQLSSYSSPSFLNFPYSQSLHPEELEDQAEISYPDSHAELQSTPSCNEVLRRQWHALSLRVRFGVLRARRRMRGIVGKGKKD